MDGGGGWGIIKNYLKIMRISAVQKTTLIDYPGKIAATVFTVGCNFRCPWCYSKEFWNF